MQQLAHRAVVALIKRGNDWDAKRILDYSGTLLLERDDFSRNMHLFTRGFHAYSFGDKLSGTAQMKDAIYIFDRLGSLDLARHYQKFYDTNVDETPIQTIEW